MEEREYLVSLYDYYGKLLTKKQQEYFEDYYFDNLTMEEISENDLVSKNAISKQLINIKDKLNYYESKLELYNNKKIINELIIGLEKAKIEEINKYI